MTDAEVELLYWVFKWVAFAPLCRVLYRPTVTGRENIPEHGAAILVSNHISAGDTYLLPAMIKRRLTFPAKAELFEGRGLKGRAVGAFLKGVGQVPMDRTGGRASASAMESVLGVLKRGELLCIFPEGTRSPDGRLYKGKTGVARLVVEAGVPVIPVGMIGTEMVPSKRLRFPTMNRPRIVIGPPLDFSAYAGAGNDRDVLRWITDEIMNAVMELSGQTYVDVYGSAVKAALTRGQQELPGVVRSRPGEGRSAPPLPGGSAAERVTP